MQLERARQFCMEQDLDVHLRLGDMRQLPFEDDTFDYVYEHYSMCHLSKGDTAQAAGEMIRVLKPGGLCFLGVISTDSWPLSFLGQEREPGEYWSDEGGEETLHSAFTDQEADALVSVCEIVSKEKHVRYLSGLAEDLSLEAWMDLRQEADPIPSEEAWQARYAQRANAYRYAHLYYCLRTH
jgi:ubiquinone/menaquinone biosynthesis C-methylase UbiE